MSEATGEILGRHHCVERLGEGPLGVSYRARVFGIGAFVKDFSLTVTHRELSCDEKVSRRLVRAATRAAQLGGERLQQLHSLDRVGDRYYLVSELVIGVELGLLLELLRARRQPLPVQSAALIVLEAAEALASAHARTELDPIGVLHLGISPSTLVIDEAGRTRILHTGLYGALVRPGWAPRKLPRAFLAPEVVAGGPYTRTADVYSLGAVLHDAIGFQPEAERLRPIVRRAMDPDPQRRFSSLMDLRAALDPHVDRALGCLPLADLASRYGMPRSPEDATEASPGQRPGSLQYPTEASPGQRPGSLQYPTEASPGHAAPPGGEPLRLGPIPERVPDWGPPPPGPAPEPPPDLHDTIVDPRAHLDDELAITGERPPAAPPPSSIPQTPAVPLAALHAPVPRRWPRLALFGVPLVGVGVLAVVGLKGSPPARPEPPAIELPPREPPVRALQGEASRPLLTVDVTPPDARVFLDGEDAGRAPLERRLDPGEHRVVLVAEGYFVRRDQVTLAHGDARLAVHLEPARLPPGVAGEAGLKLRCRSRGLRILVDGADTGRTCPNETRIEVAPGRHTLGLYEPAGDRTIDLHKHPNVPLQGRSTRILVDY
jgi:hypothetical protein